MKTLHKHLFIILFAMVSWQFASAQQEALHDCADHQHPTEVGNNYNDNQQKEDGEVCFQKCENWYAPKIINLHFHVIQDQNGERNFQSTDGWWFQAVVDAANNQLANNDHYANPNLSFQIEDITFVQETDWCRGPGVNPNYPPEMAATMNVYMVENCGDWAGTGCSPCWGGWSSGSDNIKMHRSYFRHVNDGHICDEFLQRGNLLIHEVGHSLTLGHNWVNDGCDDTNGESDNHMSWSPCDNDYFTCCQVERMHTWLETSSEADFHFTPNNSVCEASFELTNVFKKCTVTLTNTSTPSVPNAIIYSEWCVENLETGEIFSSTDTDLVFQAEGGTDYEICLCISDGSCEAWTCEIMNFDPVPAGYTSDVNGDFKDHFCLGEDVYFNGTDSENENRWFLSIWKYEIGGFASGAQSLDYSRTDPEWTWGEAGIIHLNPIYANFADPSYFEPGYEYRVQFVVRGFCDPGGWNVIEDILFYVDCCPGDEALCDASFTSVTTVNPDGTVTINVSGAQGNPWSTNGFGIYTHDQSGQGPYTYNPMGSGDGFTFNGTAPGCFTIVNKVTTPCGECCFSEEICIDIKPGNDEEATIVKKNTDCSIIDKLCKLTPPANLGCSMNKFNSLVLSWSSVPGASHYEIEYYFFDPECCGGEGGFKSSVVTEKTSITMQLFPTCMSYRVRAICEDGSKSPYSAKKCFNIEEGCPVKEGPEGPEGPQGPDKEKGENVIDVDPRTTVSNHHVTVYPNPTTGQIDYTIHKGSATATQLIQVRDINGQVISRIKDFEENDQEIRGVWNFGDNAPGMYLFEVVLDNEVITKKIIKLE